MPGIQLTGASNSRIAEVTKEGKLETLSASIQLAHHINFVHENSFVVLDTVVPDATSADFFYIKNLSDEYLVISEVDLWCEGTEIVEFYRNPSGTPTNVTELTPPNCNFASNVYANGNFYSGNSIDGLTMGEKRNRIHLPVGSQQRYSFPNFTVLPKNTTFKATALNGGNEIDFWFQFYFVRIDNL